MRMGLWEDQVPDMKTGFKLGSRRLRGTGRGGPGGRKRALPSRGWCQGDGAEAPGPRAWCAWFWGPPGLGSSPHCAQQRAVGIAWFSHVGSVSPAACVQWWGPMAAAPRVAWCADWVLDGRSCAVCPSRSPEGAALLLYENPSGMQFGTVVRLESIHSWLCTENLHTCRLWCDCRVEQVWWPRPTEDRGAMGLHTHSQGGPSALRRQVT